MTCVVLDEGLLREVQNPVSDISDILMPPVQKADQCDGDVEKGICNFFTGKIIF